jgi:predicted RNA-binding protein YlxR (DUF448 family)
LQAASSIMPTETVAASPIRKCIVTGEELPPERMIRFVAGPSGEVVPDLARKLPGRGMWVKAERALVGQARERRLFAKAAKAAVKADEDLEDRIEWLLLERVLADLGRARRAGRAVAGFVRVEQMIGRQQAGLLIVAMEADGDGLSKLRATGLPIERLADAPALGRVFGRDQAVYVALSRDDAGGQFVRRISEGAARWRDFRPVDASRQS